MRQLKITASITTREPVLDMYLRDIDKVSLLSPHEEVELAEQIKTGNRKALDQLVKANLRFVVSVAKKYQGQGLALSDMINEGNIGLFEAAKRFDHTRGFRFTSYAVWHIRQRIMVALSEHAKLIRVPINRLTTQAKVYQASYTLEQQLDRMPSSEELAEILEITAEEVDEIVSIKTGCISLDSPVSNDEDSGTLYDMIENPDCGKTETEFVFNNSLKTELTRLMDTLSDNQKKVLRYFFGLGLDRALSLDEIADKMELTRERIRQIKDKAIEKLRGVCDFNRLCGFLAA